MSRYVLALLGAVVLAGCGSGGTAANSPGTITLSLSPLSGSAEQGGQATTTATLTRSGFTGRVNLTITGAPAGVTSAISNPQTSGTTASATVTVEVAASTVPGIYSLVVHGAGTGVTEATTTYTLTVTATAGPAP